MTSYLSNLPMSCTSEMLEALHGESKIKDAYECSACMRECDPFEFHKHLVTTKAKQGTFTQEVCSDCIKMCDLCGEWLDDDTADRGILVNYREVANDGKLTHGHAECVGEWMAEVNS